MRILLKLDTTLVLLGCWIGLGVHCTVAQNHPSPSALLKQLQSPQSSDGAKDALLKAGKSDPAVRRYLAIHLPPLIESGPSSPDCSGYSCKPWISSVEIASQLKLPEAAPALAKWIDWRYPGAPLIGLGPEERLEFNPLARALIEIGDPAVPTVRYSLDYGNSRQHDMAVRVLCMIHSPRAKAVLRGDLPHESGLYTQMMIQRALEDK